MTFIYQIQLTTVQSALVLLICLYIVWSGRPEWAVGIYLSTAGWTRSLMIGPYAHTWVYLATMVGAAAVYILRNRSITLMPSHDRWIVPWMGVWWMWMLLLIGLFRPQPLMPLVTSLLLYTIAPLPFILLFAADLRRIRGFALAYLLNTMVGGWVALAVLRIPLAYLRVDPTLSRLEFVRLGIENYHWFAYTFAISLILIMALFQESRHRYLRLGLVLCAGWCACFLLLSGSRQALGGVAIALLLFVLWTLAHKKAPRVQAALLAGVIVSIVVLLYQTAPHLVLRPGESGPLEAYAAGGGRMNLWAFGWHAFTSSPIWGQGFTEYVYPHNIFIGILADQGVVGMVFIIGFLVFAARQVQGVWARWGTKEQAIWRMAFFCVALFGLIHAQVSGGTHSVWHLFWSVALLWRLREAVGRPSPVRQRMGYVVQAQTPIDQLR